MIGVNVIYHQFPHYRRAVLRALVQAGRFDYRFFGDCRAHEGIMPFAGDELVAVEPLVFTARGRALGISGYGDAMLDGSAKVLLLNGNPNIVATWIMAAFGRLTGKTVLFWAHGWLRREPVLKGWVRNFYYGLGHGVLTYGARAPEIAAASGFDARRITVIGNSLDLAAIDAARAGLAGQTKGQLRAGLRLDAEQPVLIAVARLTRACRFDLLIEAAAMLSYPVQIVLVGDGSERGELERLAEERQVAVRFVGPLHDETALAPLMLAADLTVSPGKVGLTAIHSMAYGVPVISHGNMDHQMPEAEAIREGETGAFFDEGNVELLAGVIDRWLRSRGGDDGVARACRDLVHGYYDPALQAERIADAIERALSR